MIKAAGRSSIATTASFSAAPNPSISLDTDSVGDPQDDPFYRLYHTPKSVPKQKADENQALISDLPTHTLKWIKKRRSIDTEKKVVLSPQAERQLREMFNSLDVNHSGTISLVELTEAVIYVQEKTKGAKGLEAFQNIASVFAAMDDNGDGTIDFTEFTNGMTGTANSAFEKASPYDIEKLFSYFVEFGERKQREHALRKINEALGHPQSSPSASTSTRSGAGSPAAVVTDPSPTGKKEREVPFNGDTPYYQSFKSLFGNDDISSKAKNEAIRKSQEIAAKKAKQMEMLLQEFLTNPIPIDESDPAKVAAENKLKDLRKQQIEVSSSA